MNESDKLLKTAMKSLLNEKLSEFEIEELREIGFTLKNPTRKSAVVIALYKKAVSGDLSAIKELRSLISENKAEITDTRKVMIVDDIGNKDVGDSGKGI